VYIINDIHKGARADLARLSRGFCGGSFKLV